MGWKNVKERYRIDHRVQVTQEGICIGSAYIYNLIVIGMNGVIIEPYRACEGLGWGVNPDLKRYETEMLADPEALRKAVLEPDTFSRSLPVWTYDGGDIIEKQCEEYGWPNNTHDGLLMYDNTFSEDREKVVKWAVKDAKARRKILGERVAECVSNLEKARQLAEEANRDLKKLTAGKSASG